MGSNPLSVSSGFNLIKVVFVSKNTRGGEAEGKSDTGQNRTRDQKGLDDHISPYCTLSQNGYGAALLCWTGRGDFGGAGPKVSMSQRSGPG